MFVIPGYRALNNLHAIIHTYLLIVNNLHA